MLNVEMKVDG